MLPDSCQEVARHILEFWEIEGKVILQSKDGLKIVFVLQRCPEKCFGVEGLTIR